MKKTSLGENITVLANVGVLAGILLLVFELNQASQLNQGQTRTDITNQQITLVLQRVTDPGLGEIYWKGRTGETLTTLEEGRLHAYRLAFWRYRENASYQFRNGLYEEDEYRATLNLWISVLNRSSSEKTTFCRVRNNLSPVFVSEVEGLLETPCD